MPRSTPFADALLPAITSLTPPAQVPTLPTYQAIADYLSHKNDAGFRMVGWTFARSLLMFPGIMLIGVPPGKAFKSALAASTMVTVFALINVWAHGSKLRENGINV